MTADAELEQVIAKYSVNTAGAKAQVEAICPVIKRWGNEYLLEAIYSGSLVKGTAVSIATDADVFLSLSSSTPDPLGDIYNSLFNALKAAGFQPQRQNVSIGLRAGGYKIDFVPGRRQSQTGYDHSLYKSKSETWTKTNVKEHINLVANSGRLREIKLTKIWRGLHSLDFPSFYLELAVIDHLKGAPLSFLSDNFWSVLGFLSGDFPTKSYLDPSNTSNVISDDLTNSEKVSIQAAAQMARLKKYWSEIVW